MTKTQNANHVRNELRKLINFIMQNGLPVSPEKAPVITGFLDTTIGAIGLYENEYALTNQQARHLEAAQ